jgi:bacteriorhodopsin
MDMKTDMRRLYQWEHNVVMSGEKLIHQEAFWVGVAVVAMLAFFVMAMVLGAKSPSPRSIFPIPLGPIY